MSAVHGTWVQEPDHAFHPRHSAATVGLPLKEDLQQAPAAEEVDGCKRKNAEQPATDCLNSSGPASRDSSSSHTMITQYLHVRLLPIRRLNKGSRSAPHQLGVRRLSVRGVDDMGARSMHNLGVEARAMPLCSGTATHDALQHREVETRKASFVVAASSWPGSQRNRVPSDPSRGRRVPLSTRRNGSILMPWI